MSARSAASATLTPSTSITRRVEKRQRYAKYFIANLVRSMVESLSVLSAFLALGETSENLPDGNGRGDCK